jgi:hypothetical protein
MDHKTTRALLSLVAVGTATLPLDDPSYTLTTLRSPVKIRNEQSRSRDERKVTRQARGSQAIDRIPASMRIHFAERRRDVKSLTWEFRDGARKDSNGSLVDGRS